MFLATEESSEAIWLVADRNEEFAGRCSEWYTIRSRDLSSQFHHRYGGYTTGDRQKLVGLQAADLLAYSALRNLTGDNGWYWPEMTSGTPLLRAVADDEFWRNVSAGLDNPMGGDD